MLVSMPMVTFALGQVGQGVGKEPHIEWALDLVLESKDTPLDQPYRRESNDLEIPFEPLARDMLPYVKCRLRIRVQRESAARDSRRDN